MSIAIDNVLDREVDKIMDDLDSDTPEQFAERWHSLSFVSKITVRAMILEQAAFEDDPHRAARIKRLETRILEIEETI